jgi:hypothetical protein
VADQRIRAGPVQVSVIDDGDVTGPQSRGQALGLAVKPGRRSNSGQVI